MNRITQVGAAVLGGAALLGVGVVVGSHVGQPPETIVAAAPAEGPLNQQDQYLMQAFMSASQQFDALLAKARKGDKSVGPAMTKQAVLVLSVKRNAKNPQLHDAAEAAAQAMLLIGAGLTANDGGAVKDGVAEYKVAQQKVVDLGKILTGGQDPAATETVTPTPASSAPAPQSSSTP